jgi:hypothetical protein
LSTKLIRSLYEQRLAAWAAARSLQVAWQNVSFTPPSSGLYLRAFLLPATTDVLDLAGEYPIYRGVFQISIVAPSGQGSGAAEQLVEDVSAEFPADLLLTSGALSVMIVSSCSQGPAIQDSTSYMVPVSFTYEGRTP